MQDNANKRQWIMTELAAAIHNLQMQVHYQPIIQIASRKVIGAEALLRWHHPHKGLIVPDHFIPIAEHNGLISSLSEWLIEICLLQTQKLRENFKQDYHIAINISMAEFLSQAHMERMINLFKNNPLVQAKGVIIELTESLKLIDNEYYRNLLVQMKDCGCKIALDDFGTGQSSLSYIKKVPVDIIKIDKSFIRDIVTDPNDAAMVQAILQLAKAFNLVCVAEGVETVEQLAFLKQNGCEYAQGHLFARAMPYDELVSFLSSYDDKNLSLS